MRVDYHVHTCFSPGCSTHPRQVVRTAIRRGLDAVAITDHDSMDGWKIVSEYASNEDLGLAVVPAAEVTTREGAHVLALNISRTASERPVLDVLDDIHAQEGTAVLAHPFDPRAGLFGAYALPVLRASADIDSVMREVDAVEVVNAHAGPQDIERNIAVLRAYPWLGWTAGSDAHSSAWIGAAYAIVDDGADAWRRGALVYHHFGHPSCSSSLVPRANWNPTLVRLESLVSSRLHRRPGRALLRPYQHARQFIRDWLLWRRAERLWRHATIITVVPEVQ